MALDLEECAYLVLGCHGRTENGFILCSGVQNRILKLNDSLVNIDGVIDYLEAVRLFDRPMLDQNAVRHLIYNLQDRFDQKFKRLWTDHEYNLIERFIHMHKQCGVYAQLIIVLEEDQQTKDKEQVSFVQGIPEKERPNKVISLAGMRGRKFG
jgi:hypothetical protein